MKETKKTGFLYKMMFKVWRRLPPWVTGPTYKVRWLKNIKVLIRDLAASLAGRDDIYNPDYYSFVDTGAAHSVGPISRAIVTEFAPKTVIDIGCGTGALLDAFVRQNVRGFGLEYSEAGLAICQKRQLMVEKFDLTRSEFKQSVCFDVATCMEVAEHVPSEYADRLVSLITKMSDTIVFTAATPGQGGGPDHVNEQPHEYWITKFKGHGYAFDESMAVRWRKEWREKGVAGCYFHNVMIFRKS